jgi:hypothetical protein
VFVCVHIYVIAVCCSQVIFKVHIIHVESRSMAEDTMSVPSKEISNMDMLVHNSNEKGVGNVVSRRLNKILETRLENDKETLEALKELSTFFTENTLQARRNLRSKIEKRSLVINEVFIRCSNFKKSLLSLTLIQITNSRDRRTRVFVVISIA